MPRNPTTGVYTYPTGIEGVSGQTVESGDYNSFLTDVQIDLNAPRPIVAGGSGASSADEALYNLKAEKATHIVTNFNSHIWAPGSFRSAAAAIGAPNATAAFSGICYLGEDLANPLTNANVTVEARDGSSGMLYIRRKIAGVWGAWASDIAGGKKNYIINGAMMVSQENGSNAGLAGGAAFYPVDQFTYAASVGGFSLQQAAMTTPGGSPNRMRIAVTTVDASVGAGDLVVLTTALEGLRVADLLSGTALAKTVTLQFGIRTLAGTYCVSFRNDGSSRSYVTAFTISAGEASTDVIKTVTLPLDVTGTWKNDNTAGINIAWCLMAGTTYQTGTPNAWTASANAYATSAQTNWMGNPIATLFELFDVSLTEGSVAPLFAVPDYASELAACQRYFQWARMNEVGMVQNQGAHSYAFWHYPTVYYRAQPTATLVMTTLNIECPPFDTAHTLSGATLAGSAVFNTGGVYRIAGSSDSPATAVGNSFAALTTVNTVKFSARL